MLAISESAVYMDMTYEINKLYTTILLHKNTLVQRRSDKSHPFTVAGIAFTLHRRGSDYEWFANALFEALKDVIG